MNTIGFTPEELKQIWSILSGILQFGNMEFSENKRDDSASIKNNEGASTCAYGSRAVPCSRTVDGWDSGRPSVTCAGHQER
jgi:hypothetical protein